MELACGIVRDLLPLVVEGLSGEESRAAVMEHIAACPECRRVKSQLEQDAVPEFAPETPLQAVKNEIVAKRRRTVGIAVGLVLAVVFCVFARLTEPVRLPYSDDLLTVDTLESGDLLVTVSQSHAGITVEHTGVETTLSVWKNALSPQNDRETLVIPSEELGSALYYADFAGEDTLIWGSTTADGRQTLPRLVLGYYLAIAAGMAVILGILAAVCRKTTALYLAGTGVLYHRALWCDGTEYRDGRRGAAAWLDTDGGGKSVPCGCVIYPSRLAQTISKCKTSGNPNRLGFSDVF